MNSKYLQSTAEKGLVVIIGSRLAKVSGRNFPISAIRVRKFGESTQFRAEGVKQSAFIPPYSLNEGLARTIESEFPR